MSRSHFVDFILGDDHNFYFFLYTLEKKKKLQSVQC